MTRVKQSVHLARGFLIGLTLMGLSLAGGAPSQAQGIVGIQDAPTNSQEQYREIINSNTLTAIGSGLTGGNIKLIDDIAKAVNDGHKLRLLPMIGEGSSQNIRDILYLRGIDVGTVKLGSVESYEKEPLFADLRNRLQYIAALSGQEFHIVGNPNIGSLKDLEGKKVGGHGGGFVAVQDLFVKLKIKPAEVVEVDFYKGLEQVKNGQLDAVARLTSSPMKDFNEKVDLKSHKIIPVPFDEALIEEYLPGKLTHKAYPDLIPEGEWIETISSPTALVSYAWKPDTERYRRVAKFTEAFFNNFPKLMADKDRHPSWDSVNLAAELRGWKRFPAAQEWLDRHKFSRSNPGDFEKFKNTLTTSANIGDANNQKLRSELFAFLQKQGGAPIPPEKMDEIFREFLEWQRSSGKQSAR
jgi:TRAP-type uncharacterized transport system substrate-binding protein